MANESPARLSGFEASIERRGLRDRVYDQILRLLLSGDAAPGSRLSIDTMARELNVSPTPVREALVQLERTGLVTREALKGYRVAPPLGAQQLDELFEARLMLEAQAARLATPASDEMLAQLRSAEDLHRETGRQVIESIDQGVFDVELTTAYFMADTAFHDVIFEHSGNRYIQEMSASLGAQLHRNRQILQFEVTDVRDAIAEHEAIAEAFAGTDPDAPEKLMRRHIRQVRKRSLALAGM